MKNIWKYAMMMFLCFVFLGTLQVSAADELLGTVVDGSLLTEETEVTVTVYPKARWTYLSNGTGTMSITGTRTIRMTGTTTASQKVDVIYVNMYLQRLKNGTWVNFYTGTRGTKYDAYYVSSTDYDIAVEGGYYYRAIGGHVINEDGTVESASSYTNGIWVD